MNLFRDEKQLLQEGQCIQKTELRKISNYIGCLFHKDQDTNGFINKSQNHSCPIPSPGRKCSQAVKVITVKGWKIRRDQDQG